MRVRFSREVSQFVFPPLPQLPYRRMRKRTLMQSIRDLDAWYARAFKIKETENLVLPKNTHRKTPQMR